MRIPDAHIVEVLAKRADATSRVDSTALREAVPPELRLLHYTRQTVPNRYLSSFAFYHKKIGPFHLDQLPEPMQNEVMFAVWRIVELGGRVPVAPMSLLTRELAHATAHLREHGKPWESLVDRTPAEWRTELLKSWARRSGALPNPETSRTFLSVLDRICKLVWFAYDSRPWWQREVWDLRLDPRIPRTPHEMQDDTAIHWHRLQPEWLRRGAMYFVKSQLELGQMRWSSAIGTYWQLLPFGQFLEQRAIVDPRLVDDVSKLRPLLLQYVAELRSHLNVSGRNKGKPRSKSSVAGMASTLRTLYAFMCDFGREAAVALDEPRWEDIYRNYDYLRLWRPGDVPETTRVQFDERHLISGSMMQSIAARAHLLGAPPSEGGLGDEQAMRILLLMMATGRRINEICKLDLEPIVPVENGSDEADAIAKLRYQQTKISGAPDTIFVGSEVIAIVAEQQAWLRNKFGPDVRPGYLFVRFQSNLRGPARLQGWAVAASVPEARRSRRSSRTRRHSASTHPDPPVPAHQGDGSDQRGCAAARRAAVHGAHEPRNDDALRPDARRDREGRVSALPQGHQPWLRPRGFVG